jgi:hypothetical protein
VLRAIEEKALLLPEQKTEGGVQESLEALKTLDDRIIIFRKNFKKNASQAYQLPDPFKRFFNSGLGCGIGKAHVVYSARPKASLCGCD